MAVRLNNTAEGQANGTAISTGSNTGAGSGDIFSASKTATATLRFDNTVAAHGSMAYYFSFTAASENAFLQWAPAGEAQDTYALRGYLYITGAPAANDQFVAAFRNSSGNVLSLAVSTAKRFKIINAAGSTSFTGTVDIPLSTWVRFEIICGIAGSPTTSNGIVKFKWFTGDSTTANEAEFSSTAMNVGTTQMAAVRFGRASSLTSTWSYTLDDLALQTAASGYIGQFGANILPVVSAGVDQSVPVSTLVTLTGTASDSDGTIASQGWTQLTGPTVTLSGSGASRTFTPTVGGVYTFQFSATDNDGGISTADMTLRVRDSSATVWRISSNAGGFVNTGGAADLVAALGDASDTTFAESPAAPSGAIITSELTPLTAGIVSVVTRDVASSASPAVTRQVEILVNGSSLVTNSFTLTASVVAHTTSTPSSVAADAVVEVRVTDTQ